MIFLIILVCQFEDFGFFVIVKSMMNEVLLFLFLDKGIESLVDDVKYFCVSMVVKICKRGGSVFKFYIFILMVYFFGFLSMIELEVINYYYQWVGEVNRDKFDKFCVNVVL